MSELIPENRLEHWLNNILTAMGGGTKTYTVSGTGTIPSAVPEGLVFPETMVEGFSAVLDMEGTTNLNRQFTFTQLPLIDVGVISGNYPFELLFQGDSYGETSAEFGIDDGDLIFSYGYDNTEQIDTTKPLTWTITITDSRGGGGGGTTDYDDLTNKPSINGVTLIGDKSGRSLGLGYRIIDTDDFSMITANLSLALGNFLQVALSNSGAFTVYSETLPVSAQEDFEGMLAVWAEALHDGRQCYFAYNNSFFPVLGNELAIGVQGLFGGLEIAQDTYVEFMVNFELGQAALDDDLAPSASFYGFAKMRT